MKVKVLEYLNSYIPRYFSLTVNIDIFLYRESYAKKLDKEETGVPSSKVKEYVPEHTNTLLFIFGKEY